MNDMSYQPECFNCSEQGVLTLATEQRHGVDLCGSCASNEDEAAYEASLSDYYGGSGPQSDRERFNVDAMNRGRR